MAALMKKRVLAEFNQSQVIKSLVQKKFNRKILFKYIFYRL